MFLSVDENAGSNELIFEYSLYLKILFSISESFSQDESKIPKRIIIKKPMFVLLEIDLYLQKLFKIECSI
tara:strand:+ start:1554 stop:1763 length:210 start_codon:yes stop_codon:yes gene_type:complete